MKKAFTMIEILVAMILLGFLIIGSVKAMKYLRDAHQVNELRYLALNKIDSEMARLVANYKSYTNSDFASFDTNTTGNWYDNFDVNWNLTNEVYEVYKENAISAQGFGLLIDDSPNKHNLIEIKNISGNFGEVDNNDIIGLLGWKIMINDKNESNISLSIRYPYRFNSSGDGSIVEFKNFNETINLKTSASKVMR